jgi:hypothetical protein
MTSRRLIDHLVGPGEERLRDREAERLRGAEIDDQLDLRGLLNRQIGRLRKAPSKSPSTPAVRTSSLSPKFRAAASRSFDCLSTFGFVGRMSAPMVVALGTTPCSSSSRFASSSTLNVGGTSIP